MANSDINLYHFYKRYLWRDQDFQGWQDGMVDSTRGVFEGLFNGAVLSGLEVTPVTGSLDAIVSVGIATGPTGNLMVNDVSATASFTSDASLPVKSLVVIRPKLTENEFITRPTNAFDSVPLKQQQGMEIVVVPGTPSATPDYPAILANDVVLAGVRLEPAATSLDITKMDYEERDVPGKRPVEFHQHTSKYDDRTRPYRLTNTTLGIKPSQTFGSRPKLFTYIDKGVPTVFPKDLSGNFVAADTFVDFEGGTITGGDQVTPDFTPVIPTAGNSIVAVVSMLASSTLDIAYGTQGTYEECYLAIQNQTTAGPGAITQTPGAFRIAFVIVTSLDGSTVSDINMVDARSTFYFGGAANGVLIDRTVPVNETIPVDWTLLHPNMKVTSGITVTAPSGSFAEIGNSLDVSGTGVLDIQPGATMRVY